MSIGRRNELRPSQPRIVIAMPQPALFAYSNMTSQRWEMPIDFLESSVCLCMVGAVSAVFDRCHCCFVIVVVIADVVAADAMRFDVISIHFNGMRYFTLLCMQTL